MIEYRVAPRIFFRDVLHAALAVMLGCVCSSQIGCKHRSSNPNLVQGDAYFDASDLDKYHENFMQPAGKTTGMQAEVEAAVIKVLSKYAGTALDFKLPEGMEIIYEVKDTSGNLLAAHVLQRGHNRWSDAITAKPIDLFVKVKIPLVKHEFFLRRVEDPYAQPIDMNIMYELLHRVW